MYINTAGIGRIREGVDVASRNARPGDAVIVTGTIGDHGVAVLSRREGLKFETELKSDVAPLNGLVGPLLDAVPTVHCLRDPTRGGVAAALNDIAEDSQVGIRIRETELPVRREVHGACDLFGFDVLDLANEGKAVVVCDGEETDRVMGVLRSCPLGRDSVVIGRVIDDEPGIVVMETEIGGERIVEIPSGENLPRIC
jgi:hydrogenase expression/formation protein HypE